MPAGIPNATTIKGRYCTLEHLDCDRHADSLFAAYSAAPDSRDWTYMPYGPFRTASSYREWVTAAQASPDPWHFAVIDNSTKAALGTASLMRHDRANRSVEVGNVAFSQPLQRTRISTETHYLLMRYAFDTLGYRRYEWKCDSLNIPSRHAAERLGFTYEGTFRQAVIYKNRNRDTTWYSILDQEWPSLKVSFQTWLAPTNFDEMGRQINPLRTR